MQDLILKQILRNQTTIMEVLKILLDYSQDIHHEDAKKLIYDLDERIRENG